MNSSQTVEQKVDPQPPVILTEEQVKEFQGILGEVKGGWAEIKALPATIKTLQDDKGDLQATVELLRGLVGDSWPTVDVGREAERSSAIQQTGGLRYGYGHDRGYKPHTPL